MIEIVINRCGKGSLLGDEGIAEYERRTGSKPDPATIARTDPVLLAMMKEDPEKYAGDCAHISIIELPDGFKWKLMSKHKIEWIAADVS